jgi:Tfp pilus assembly protein PilF
MQPERYDIRYNLGFVLIRLGRNEEAARHLKKALELNPRSSEARYQLARALRGFEQHERAQAELKIFEQQKQAGVQENAAAVLAHLANQYLDAGDARRAAETYREALRPDPNNARTHYNLSLALARLEDLTGHREALQKAVLLAPARNDVGLLEFQAGRAAEAERHFRAALEADPQYAEA